MKSDKSLPLPKTGGPFYTVFRIFMLILFRTLGGEIIGAENMRNIKQCFIASNHIGRMEAFWVHVCIQLKKVSIIAKKELFRTPYGAWFMFNVGAFPVDREKPGTELIRYCNYCTQLGHSILIFIQGTRCKAFTRESVKPGIGRLAVKYKLPVLPVHYKKMVFSLDKNKRQHLIVTFGKPIQTCDHLGNPKDSSLIEEEVFQAIHAMDNPI